MHIFLGLIVAFVLVALFARRNRHLRGCRWRADRNGNAGGLYRYHCMACGAEAFSTSDAPPNYCGRPSQRP